PAPIVMTLPSGRWRPAMRATRSSLIPFWKSTITPFDFLRYWTPSDAAHSVSYDLTEMKIASKGSVIDCASEMRGRLTRTTWSPPVPLRRRPSFRIFSTCSGHWSMSVTSCPALVSMPPTTLPMAPAPMIPIRIAMGNPPVIGAPRPAGPQPRDGLQCALPLHPGHDNLNRHALRLRSPPRPPAHRQLQVAE